MPLTASDLTPLCGSLSPPTHASKVWKSECPFSFVTAESPEGIYINLTTFQAFSKQYVSLDYQRTGNVLYLHHKRLKTPKEKTKEEESGAPAKKLAIGMEGGFQVDDEALFDITDSYRVLKFPDLENFMVYPSNDLPMMLTMTISALISMDDQSKKKTVEAWSADNEMLQVSKHADNLEQLDNGIKISSDPSTWVCQESGLKENLWLNLSTGYIGSGRRNWDGTGGTGAALRHYEETGRKYPLAVKLGTISSRPGSVADVYSYDPSEDGMVIDPHLAKHLEHWGIKMSEMEKTEKSMAELEVEMNQKYDWSKIVGDAGTLTMVTGSGFVGLENLGNSCYMNSVVQALMSTADFQKRYYYGSTPSTLMSDVFPVESSVQEPQEDLTTQLIKLASGMSDPSWQITQDDVEKSIDGVSGKTLDSVMYVKPTMLKQALASGHSDFTGSEQQDAFEFLQHVLDLIKRNEATKGNQSEDPTQHFRFDVEERLEDMQSHKVAYKVTSNNVVSLSVPLDKSTGTVNVENSDEKRQIVPFEECLKASIGRQASATATMNDYRSPVTGQIGVATKSAALLTFPKYLWVRMERYVIENWQQKKLEVDIPVPETINLSDYKAVGGLRPGEEELPSGSATEARVEPDPAIVSQLMGMGFPENGCKRAVIATQNAGMEVAMEWVLTNMSDPDFDKPIDQSGSSIGQVDEAMDPGALNTLQGMGFETKACAFALEECGGNLEQAANWLFNHAHEVDQLIKAKEDATVSTGQSTTGVANVGNGQYKMKAIVSHLGKSVHGGHYVCHVKKKVNGTEQWVLHNDRKTAISTDPPLALGYLYLFEAVV